MSLRGLLVLLTLFALSVAALFWLEHAPAKMPSAPSDAPLLGPFTIDTVREIELRSEGTAVTLRQNAPRGWRVVRPIETEADPRRVHEVVAALQDAKVRKVIEDKATDLAPFGLAPPACSATLDRGAAGPALTLRVGRASPVGTERYATVDGTKVLLTDGSLYNTLTHGPEAFRETRLIPVEPGEIVSIALTRPDGRLAVALADGGCRLDAPYADAASESACTSLARAVASLTLSGPFDTAPPADARADRVVKIEVQARGVAAPFLAFVAAAGVAGRRVAWRDGAALVGLLGDRTAAPLLRPAESFRDLRIVTFSTPDVVRLTIARGTTILSLARAGESAPWTGSTGGTTFAVDGARVDALLDTLRGLTGTGFEAARPEGEAAATVSLFGKTGEIARLTFGPLARPAGSSGDDVWLTTPARPNAVFRLDAATLAGVPRSASDLAQAGR